MKYGAGTYIEVKLDDQNAGLGLVIGMGPTGMGYFCFFKKFVRLPASIVDVETLTAEDILFVMITGTSEFRRKNWRSLGTRDDWNVGDWPRPVFASQWGHEREYRLVEYDLEDPAIKTATREISAETADGMPRNGVWTATTAAAWLRKNFRDGTAPRSTIETAPPDNPYALCLEVAPKQPPVTPSALSRLSIKIEAVLARSGVGTLDGDEFDSNTATLYFEGENGDKILDAIHKLITTSAEWIPLKADLPRSKTLTTTLVYHPELSRWLNLSTEVDPRI